MESELFGHEKGAFTQADKVLEQVGLKCLLMVPYLDEIGDIPLSLQAKLLRALESKKIKSRRGKRNSIKFKDGVCHTSNLEKKLTKGHLEQIYFIE